MVNGKLGVILIGIGIIAVIVLAPRELFTRERAQGFLGTFGLQPAQAEIPLVLAPRTTMVSPKPKRQLISTKPAQIAGGTIFVKTEKNGFLQSFDPVTGERRRFSSRT